jgi:hypothetical protein
MALNLLSLEGITIENVLQTIAPDGKDPEAFQYKLALRTEVPYPEDWDTVVHPEALDQNQEHGKYLSHNETVRAMRGRRTRHRIGQDWT